MYILLVQGDVNARIAPPHPSPCNSATRNAVPLTIVSPTAAASTSLWPRWRQPEDPGENLRRQGRNLSPPSVPNNLHTHFLRHHYDRHFYLYHPVRPLRVDVDRSGDGMERHLQQPG